MSTEHMPRIIPTRDSPSTGTRRDDAVSIRTAGEAEWAFYAVVGTSVQGGHTLARFGPERTALAALRIAVQSVNHTAYSLLEQGVAGDPCADPRLLERLPITEFTIERRRPGSSRADESWGLSGGRHRGRLGRGRVA